ncbi:ras-related protein Rab-20 [Biomphalaria glabrata]|uniref:Ras-related protein Rab-20-like n=1 Tax=Biomphalaria glabrata TaxID=6526 RepID=A0A2C9JEN3_BIOGL|nr:ras-related protein Rab-20-like [Biomphalaria glabrata]XP_013066980.1 ras-related protein Rab-20-like [Biomphalaria glabrata]XP_013066981.1 ras-related protein Rab-20-like [Biomphalaria glabrata]XP_013066985.1 ras-related protein Rab-20-like [Biomphalaria glabrata]KAI8730495.1 ras-related protein Rab-20-like [Biomphalaria glabrata]KAI8764449.1 ras-related protein Rab-20 [Biomphalaria glabrata]
MSTKKKADLKVIILGDYNVGKTSLICRYIDGTFRPKDPTVGAAFFLKQWGPHNVAVWDTAGDERYSGLSHFYCRGAGAAILAFDLNSSQTFESLWARFGSILEAANEDCLKVVVGTKMDLLDQSNRDITPEEGKKLARELNEHLDFKKMPHEPYFETSSLTNQNVDEVFQFIFQYCLPLSAEQKKKYGKGSVIDLIENSDEHKSTRRCC